MRICTAYDEDVDSVTELAERFNVGHWFIHKLLRQRRLEGSIAAKPGGHGLRLRIGRLINNGSASWLASSRMRPCRNCAQACRPRVALA